MFLDLGSAIPIEMLQQSLSALLIDRLTIKKAGAESEPRRARRCHNNLCGQYHLDVISLGQLCGRLWEEGGWKD